jgi:hypothetical protein
MKNALILVSGLLIAQVASADLASDLLGDWKMTKATCSDGSQAINVPPSFDGNLSVSVNLTSREITGVVSIDFKMKEEVANNYRQQISASRKAVEALPAGEGKDKYLADLKKAEDQVNVWAAGVKCESRDLSTYELKGNVFTQTRVSNESNCPGSVPSKNGETTDSVVSIVGNTMMVTSGTPEAEENKSCPVGTTMKVDFERAH